jgi:hypothetical protein
MPKKKYINILNKYMPAEASIYVADLIIKYQTQFNIKPPRKTKLGDYRHPHNGKGHRISVNGDLNQYSFLITTIHEFAHLTTYLKYKNKVTPHGQEWKNEFKDLFAPLFELVNFPEDVKVTLLNYLKNAKASSCSDAQLIRVLKRYDKKNDIILVEHLNIGTKFKLNRKIFVKGKRLRTYYLCKDLNSGRDYRVNGLAEIEQIIEYK